MLDHIYEYIDDLELYCSKLNPDKSRVILIGSRCNLRRVKGDLLDPITFDKRVIERVLKVKKLRNCFRGGIDLDQAGKMGHF